jgi:ATP-dependent exoDNAse (exonuclease V) beta subunit
MPGNTVAIHPNNIDKITFTEEGHTYVDSNNKKYVSVTTLIHKAFHQFDTENIAQKKADKLGISKEELLLEWENKGLVGRTNGTRLHEFAENYILNKNELYQANDINEKIRFNSSISMINRLNELFHPIINEPEKLVFSPGFSLAGSIDWLMKINDNNYIILDWKILSKDLAKEGFNNQTGIILPTLNIQDSNYWHYALQLQIYELLLKSENYIKETANVSRYLIVWREDKFTLEKMPNLYAEAWGLIAWNSKFKEK